MPDQILGETHNKETHNNASLPESVISTFNTLRSNLNVHFIIHFSMVASRKSNCRLARFARAISMVTFCPIVKRRRV